jgi:hypothetical protein
MTYRLEKIKEEDQGKIVADAVSIPSRQRDLAYLKRETADFPRTWAIDRDRGCYLIQVPSIVREPWVAIYLLFFEGRAFIAFSASLYARRLYLDDEDGISGPMIHSVKAEFVAALKVYGMFGDGPADQNGQPTEEVMPQFFDKPKSNPWL